jgi:hypothetical protein
LCDKHASLEAKFRKKEKQNILESATHQANMHFQMQMLMAHMNFQHMKFQITQVRTSYQGHNNSNKCFIININNNSYFNAQPLS